MADTRRTAGSRRAIGVWFALVACMAMAACGSDSTSSGANTTSSTVTASTATAGSAATETLATTDLVLDPNHDYGDRYADGILPVGDDHFVLDAPKTGYVYLCNELGGGGGAQTRGPWFVNDNTEYDLNAKVHVQGQVSWNGTYAVSVDGTTRRITTNDVPTDHPTGEFPIASNTEAYQYDHNPNHIEEQNFTYALPAQPAVLDTPSCMGGESGVMTSGVALFNAFDAGNRDAGAWEVQDGCDGHPQVTSEYHYHTLSSCITDVSVSTVIGWALDGFPITGPKVGDGNYLATQDLDECHGITSTIDLDGQQVTTYHYVMTVDFPYSISCFRGSPTQPPHSG